ncbi:MAG: mercuric transporter MerT family protein [Mariprofundales bacterium]
MNNNTKHKTPLLGAVIAGGLASACCLGPLLVMILGMGSASFFTALIPYRPIFAMLTIALIAWAVWQQKQQKKHCTAKNCRPQHPAWLWLFGSIALLLLVSPILLPYFIPAV